MVQELGRTSTGPGTRERIAVIGAGIGGLGAAWLLARHYEVTLFEAANRLGGHTNTVTVTEDDRELAIDTGFIVYNERNYPLLTALFRWLDVPTRASDMSFGVSIDQGRFEYAGDNVGTLFAQRRNLLRPSHWRMLLDILRFNRETASRLAGDGFGSRTLGQYLDDGRFSDEFRYRYLLPMGGAIWSCPVQAMLGFPAESFARFFDNHGLLSLADRPQWRTVTGGGREYIRRMMENFSGSVFVSQPVMRVRRQADDVLLTLRDGTAIRFDRVVMACPADEALRMMRDATARESSILTAFRTQSNSAVLHTDESLLPRRQAAWSSWNYLSDEAGNGNGRVSVSYWMNRLQSLQADRNYIVSLNPLHEPHPGSVLYRTTYRHPVLDRRAIIAQHRLPEIQGSQVYFCGAWTGYGFHEDGFRSAVKVAQHLGVGVPWEAPPKAVSGDVQVTLPEAV